MTTLSNEQCRRRLMTSEFYSTFGNDIICVYSGRYEHSTCLGDSGSPLVFDGRVIGLTTVGVGCSSGPYGEIPTGFTRVSLYVPWILQKVDS